MKIKVEVSLGELVDKLSILKIKQIKIQDQEKLKHVSIEEECLKASLEELNLKGIKSYLDELIKINSKLWDIEDQIRECERQKSFEDEFVRLARAVYYTNDQRFDIKNQINQKFGSTIKEVKSYEKY